MSDLAAGYNGYPAFCILVSGVILMLAGALFGRLYTVDRFDPLGEGW